MNRNTASLLSTLLVLGLLYHFRNQIMGLFKGGSGLPVSSSLSGAPTPGYAAGTNPSGYMSVPELFGGIGVPLSGRLTPVSSSQLGVSQSLPGDGSVIFVSNSAYDPTQIDPTTKGNGND